MFLLDFTSKQPVYEQMTSQLRRRIALGLTPAGAPMPSVRQLSAQLGVNPNTVQKAYRQMEQEGLIVTSPGRGSYITQDTALVRRRRQQAQMRQLRAQLKEGRELGLTRDQVQALLNQTYKEE